MFCSNAHLHSMLSRVVQGKTMQAAIFRSCSLLGSKKTNSKESKGKKRNKAVILMAMMLGSRMVSSSVEATEVL